jgi:hypothetical protein
VHDDLSFCQLFEDDSEKDFDFLESKTSTGKSQTASPVHNLSKLTT